MTTKLSWQKIGQKVTMRSSRSWNVLKGAVRGDEPKYGYIYSIEDIFCVRNIVYLRFMEVRDVSLFDASSFIPVYPTIVDQLRSMKASASAPERVTREADLDVTA